ncbi:hypothetical protein UFOVP1365_26 [uncultured Caudovirales phage]|uniref:Uncharacterized protein n=1 Tax=uncultured Caudovirales phage TaxID=2100421 RepID=A0A6J5S449_9CAUD|nr:hypothetical protein UFOVP1365_26 [uncultured Caudovirales phage]
MGAIEDFAMALMGPQTQQAIAAENPYYKGQGAVDSMTDTAFNVIANNAKQRGRVPTIKEALIPSLVGGLASGIFKGVGDRHQNTLLDRYQKTMLDLQSGNVPTAEDSGLSPSLFKSAKDNSSIFAIKRGLESQALQNEISKSIQIDEARSNNEIRKKLLDTAMTSPRLADRQQAMEMFRSLSGQGGAAQQGAEAVPSIQPITSDSMGDIAADPSAGQAPMAGGQARLRQLEQEVGDYDLAAKLYQKEVEDNRRAQTEKTVTAQKDLSGIQKDVSDNESILFEARKAINEAGNTGSAFPGETIRSGLLNVRNMLGDEKAGSALAARKSLEALGLQMAGQIRKMFPGDTSQQEFSRYLSASLGRGNLKEENMGLLKKLERAQSAAAQKRDYVEKAVASGQSVAEANTKFDKQFPLSKLLSGETNGVAVGTFGNASNSPAKSFVAPDGNEYVFTD